MGVGGPSVGTCWIEGLLSLGSEWPQTSRGPSLIVPVMDAEKRFRRPGLPGWPQERLVSPSAGEAAQPPAHTPTVAMPLEGCRRP